MQQGKNYKIERVGGNERERKTERGREGGREIEKELRLEKQI